MYYTTMLDNLIFKELYNRGSLIFVFSADIDMTLDALGLPGISITPVNIHVVNIGRDGTALTV